MIALIVAIALVGTFVVGVFLNEWLTALERKRERKRIDQYLDQFRATGMHPGGVPRQD